MSANFSTPLKNYGFSYEYEGTNFVFHIVASDPAEAKGRMEAMANAVFEGELLCTDGTQEFVDPCRNGLTAPSPMANPVQSQTALKLPAFNPLVDLARARKSEQQSGASHA